MSPEINRQGHKSLIRTCLIISIITINLAATAQVIGNWTFNGTVAGVPGTFNTLSTADFSPAVTTRAFNAGVEYYGHNGWPTGTIDTDYYLSFTLTPNTGYALNILSLNLRLRHSNTGSSGGSGPKQFTVRSSLDGYTIDIASGAITGSYSNFIFAPGGAFNNLPIPVTFRVYGHNSVMYSGGNNRFVFDNIQVEAIGIVLPLKLQFFRATTGGKKVAIQYHLNDVPPTTEFIVERSVDQRTFYPIASETETTFQSEKIYLYSDEKIPAGVNTLQYRLRIKKPDGTENYSRVVTAAIKRLEDKITAMYNRNILFIDGLSPKASKLFVYSSAGRLVYSYVFATRGGRQIINNLPAISAGVYFLKITGSEISQETSLLVY